MGLISVVWGILAMAWMVLALIPLLGWANWLLIPFAAVGAIIAAIGLLFTSAPGPGVPRPACCSTASSSWWPSCAWAWVAA